MLNKVLMVATAAAFLAATNGAWAYVGGNVIPQYPKSEASKNHKATNDGVGPNTAPSYPKVSASKSHNMTKDGVGSNGVPVYPKSGTH
jgi:hypothetical protein